MSVSFTLLYTLLKIWQHKADNFSHKSTSSFNYDKTVELFTLSSNTRNKETPNKKYTSNEEALKIRTIYL